MIPDDTVTRSQTVTLLWTADKPAVTAANLFGDVKGDAYYASAVFYNSATAPAGISLRRIPDSPRQSSTV